MVLRYTLRALSLVGAITSKSLPSYALSSPHITLDNGTFIGSSNGGVDAFRGIPFAEPPTGNLRLRLPVENSPYIGTHNATSFGLACTQVKEPVVPDDLSPDAKAVVNGYLGSLDFDSGEDCLTINIWKPSNITNDAKLPVLIFMYGGGFEVGSSQTLDGAPVVERSIAMGEPILYVSFNYRLRNKALGFLGGAEVKAAEIGNLGLQDQRQAFRWVQRYISAFGGDPSRVTIWGQSAGSISVAMHMLANEGNTEGLFHAAFMESGTTVPAGDITEGQSTYDTIVKSLGCLNASDTLQCLREAPFEEMKKAMSETSSLLTTKALGSVWIPRADGIFLKDPPQQAVLKGKVAKVPFITGNCDDEGTFFSFAQTNVTSSASLESYIHTNYLPKATSTELRRLFEVYPDNITLGSPFDTGSQNTLTPEFKRLAAIQGDWEFLSQRRFFTEHLAGQQNAWVYLWKKDKNITDLGSVHYVVHFVNHFDPNGNSSARQAANGTSGSLFWPRYTPSNPQLLTLQDGPIPMKSGRTTSGRRQLRRRGPCFEVSAIMRDTQTGRS
ncbi:carotenoid ester lipase precursor [Irpex lacteus]|nr:carotenoid ester lipase precursor [Irpex lacteus]